MYDMILPGDHAEIITIRERLNCDLDTAILTIFERRNLLIKSFSNEPSRDGPRTYSSVSERTTYVYESLSLIFIRLLATDFSAEDRKTKE